MNLSQKIKQLRESRGWSQRQLARKMGVDQSYVSQIENGSMPRPSFELIIKLQQVFGVRYEVFAKAAGLIDHADDIAVYEDPELSELWEKLRGLHPKRRSVIRAMIDSYQVDSQRGMMLAATG